MVKSLRNKLSKKKYYHEIKNLFFVIVGCFLLAFADAVFLTPTKIVSGGVVSVGIIVNHFLSPILHTDVNDIVVIATQAILWVIGLIAIGWKFSLRTLMASIAYPLFYTILFRLDAGKAMGFDFLYVIEDGSFKTVYLLLAGLFGGALAGAGVAVAYLGNGSTGGFDIISFIIARYSNMKEDVSGLIIDTTLIVIGIATMRDMRNGLIGIIAAFACAAAVQYIYVNSDTFVIVDIISSENEKIQDYIHKELGHGTTVIDTVGGYSGEEKKLIRVVIYQIETTELRNYIAQIDPKAFVSFTQAKTINGEGFEPFAVSHKAGQHRRRLFARLAEKLIAKHDQQYDGNTQQNPVENSEKNDNDIKELEDKAPSGDDKR